MVFTTGPYNVIYITFTYTFCCFLYWSDLYYLSQRFFSVRCTMPQNFKLMESGKRNLTLTWEPAPHMRERTSFLCYRIWYGSVQAKSNEVKKRLPQKNISVKGDGNDHNWNCSFIRMGSHNWPSDKHIEGSGSYELLTGRLWCMSLITVTLAKIIFIVSYLLLITFKVSYPFVIMS